MGTWCLYTEIRLLVAICCPQFELHRKNFSCDLDFLLQKHRSHSCVGTGIGYARVICPGCRTSDILPVCTRRLHGKWGSRFRWYRASLIWGIVDRLLRGGWPTETRSFSIYFQRQVRRDFRRTLFIHSFRSQLHPHIYRSRWFSHTGTCIKHKVYYLFTQFIHVQWKWNAFEYRCAEASIAVRRYYPDRQRTTRF